MGDGTALSENLRRRGHGLSSAMMVMVGAVDGWLMRAVGQRAERSGLHGERRRMCRAC